MLSLGAADDIPEGEARGFDFDEGSVFAVKRDGQIHVYFNYCPHLGIELNFMPDQFLDGDAQFIECANHGALFDIESGDCLAGPCKGQPLTKIEHRIENGEVVFDMPPNPSPY